MISKLDSLQLHTATVIRKATGELFFDRVTVEEAQRLGTMFLYGKIRFENDRFVINDTSYAKVSKTGQFIVGHVGWIEGSPQPFFSGRDYGVGEGFEVVEQHLEVYELLAEKNGFSISKRTDCKDGQHMEDYIPIAEFGRPDPDLILSIPEELDVEKDEQLRALARLDWLPTPEEVEAKRPVWMGEDGSYNSDHHRALCEELSLIYPHAVKPLELSEASQDKLAGTIRMVDRISVHSASMTPDVPLTVVQQTRLLVQQDRVADMRS
jgi:hypothetical protein